MYARLSSGEEIVAGNADNILADIDVTGQCQWPIVYMYFVKIRSCRMLLILKIVFLFIRNGLIYIRPTIFQVYPNSSEKA